MHRFNRYCRITMEERLQMQPRQQLLKTAQRFVRMGTPIQLFRLKQLLESYGCTYAESAIADEVAKRLPLAMKKFQEWGTANPSQQIEVSEFEAVVQELEARDRSRDKRTTSGSLKNCFPLHFEEELSQLRLKWGSFSGKFFMSCCGGWLHSEPVGHYIGSFTARRYDNHEALMMFGAHYQPLDEIRNYFGDHVALYFAWAGLYTAKLVAPAVLGCFTMAGNYFFDGGVEDNPLTLFYSIFLSLWSTAFLEAWTRRENELKFQWGSEGFETTERPRVQFSGKFEVHPLTGVEKLVHKSKLQYSGKLVISNLIGLCMIVFTSMAALNAYLVRELYTVEHQNSLLEEYGNGTWQPEWDEAAGTVEGRPRELQNSFKIASALISLVVIQTFSQIYKRVAVRMTDWENHRTQTEYEDFLIVKNLLFEFVNNYFTLFLIAFLLDPLRKIGVPWMAEILPKIIQQMGSANDLKFPDQISSCNPGAASCMSTLQRQLFIVFTLKSFMSLFKQLVKPYVKRKRRLAAENKSIKKANMIRPSDRKFPHTIENAVEREAINEPYDSNFDDFKEMSLQFGYVTLFAVSYPLAALLAWLNNIIELRLDAYQLCSVHQRTKWRTQEDIGSWAGVFQALSIINVITNACLIGFVGSQLAQQDFFVEDQPAVAPGAIQTFVDRFKMWKMWIVVVLVEHAVLMLKFAVAAFSASVPEWIRDARDAIALREDKDLHIDPSKISANAGSKENVQRGDGNRGPSAAVQTLPPTSSPSSSPQAHVDARAFMKPTRAAVDSEQIINPLSRSPTPPVRLPSTGQPRTAQAQQPQTVDRLLPTVSAIPPQTPAHVDGPNIDLTMDLQTPARGPLVESFAQAMWDFEPQHATQLQLRRGDLVKVLEQTNQHWTLVQRPGADGPAGHVPTSYIAPQQMQMQQQKMQQPQMHEHMQQPQMHEQIPQHQQEYQTHQVQNQQHYTQQSRSFRPLALGVVAASRAGWGSGSPTSRIAAAALRNAEAQGSAQQQQITRMWRQLDTGATGLLDWEQTQALMRQLGRRPETLDMKGVFDMMDPSCHGEVAFQDFVRWWEGAEAQQQLRQLESLPL